MLASDIVVVDPNDAERARRLLKPIHIAPRLDVGTRGKDALVLVFADAFGQGNRWSRLTERFDALKRDAGHLSVVVSGSFEPGPSAPDAWQRLASFMAQVAQRDAEPFVAPDDATVRRLALAWKTGAQRKLVAKAELVDDKLIVWSCEPRRYEVHTRNIPALSLLSSSARSQFSVSESGSRIHWDDGDVDLNMDTILEIADPSVRQAHLRERRAELASYGRAIRKLREERGLSQAGIPGLTDRQVRRLEQGDVVPHAATLAKLAEAHDLSVTGYLRELASLSKSAVHGRQTLGRGESPNRQRSSRRRSRVNATAGRGGAR